LEAPHHYNRGNMLRPRYKWQGHCCQYAAAMKIPWCARYPLLMQRRFGTPLIVGWKLVNPESGK
jgi:hypothetical protein